MTTPITNVANSTLALKVSEDHVRSHTYLASYLGIFKSGVEVLFTDLQNQCNSFTTWISNKFTNVLTIKLHCIVSVIDETVSSKFNITVDV